MTWWQYVLKTTGAASQVEIAHKVGISPASISRWKDSAPKPENVAAFARSYNRPVLEAFISAGFLTADEAAERPVGRPSIDSFSIEELLAEVNNRVHNLMENTGRDYFNEDEGRAVLERAQILPRDDGVDSAPPDSFDLAAHPVTDSPSMREHSNGLDRGEESQEPPEDE